MTVATLAAQGFEQSALTEPKKALKQGGAGVLIDHFTGGKADARGWSIRSGATAFSVDVALGEAQAGDLLLMLLPAAS